MKNDTKNPLVESAIHQLKYNTQLYKNALLQVNPHQAQESKISSVNSFNTILIHMLSTRFSMSRLLGLNEPNSMKELSEEQKQNPEYELWMQLCHDVTTKIEQKLMQLTHEELNAKSKFTPPDGNNSVIGVVQFLLFHEAYHFGQLGILRKTMQLESLSFAAE